MPKMRQLIAAATVLAGIAFAGTARANEITNIASAAEEITLTSGQITVGNQGTVHLPETATFLKEDPPTLRHQHPKPGRHRQPTRLPARLEQRQALGNPKASLRSRVTIL